VLEIVVLDCIEIAILDDRGVLGTLSGKLRVILEEKKSNLFFCGVTGLKFFKVSNKNRRDTTCRVPTVFV
jgi:hypothetical protein